MNGIKICFGNLDIETTDRLVLCYNRLYFMFKGMNVAVMGVATVQTTSDMACQGNIDEAAKYLCVTCIFFDSILSLSCLNEPLLMEFHLGNLKYKTETLQYHDSWRSAEQNYEIWIKLFLIDLKMLYSCSKFLWNICFDINACQFLSDVTHMSLS